MGNRTYLEELIDKTCSLFDGFNAPAREEDLSHLQHIVGYLPDEVLFLYRHYDGSDCLPKRDGARLPARLMPINDLIKTRAAMISHDNRLPKVGSVLWLWTDDNSNYCGIYTDGPLSGWLTVLYHEEPMLTPAFRSIVSFLSRVLAEVPKKGEYERIGESVAYDIPSLTRDIPEFIPDPNNVKEDKRLALHFRQLYNNEEDENVRRLYAFCSIYLTPFESTGDVLSFLEDKDMWTPEAAVRLLRLRHYTEGVDQLEKLAREGRPNGDSAAMCYLANMNTNKSRQVISRLKETLDGRKLKSLEMWLNQRFQLQPPRW